MISNLRGQATTGMRFNEKIYEEKLMQGEIVSMFHHAQRFFPPLILLLERYGFISYFTKDKAMEALMAVKNAERRRRKMEKLLLVGSGGLGRVALESASRSFECSFVDDGYSIGTQICDSEVVGHITDLPSLFGTYKKLVVSIGDNALREEIYLKAHRIGYTFPNIICPSAYISSYAQMGFGCIVLNNACVQNGAKVGNGVVLNAGVEIHHDSFVDDYALIYTNSVIRTLAKIGKRVKIGSNVTVSNNIIVNDDKTIENGCTLLL